MEDARYCPKCGADWFGSKIPEESRKYHGEKTHFSRVIGIEDSKRYDGVSWWKCPDCNTAWDRFTGEETCLKRTNIG